MKTLWILLFPVILLGFSGCWIDEAQEPQQKSLNIVADRLTREDSTLIRQFAAQYHVGVKTEVLDPKAILQRIRSERYNAGIDILMTEDETLRRELQELKAFRIIRRKDHFSQLDRQFNNRHHCWIPISHDPLIVTKAKDSLNDCRIIDFRSWHHGDSLKPVIAITAHRDDYLSLLNALPHLALLRSATRKPGAEHIYALSEFVELENKTDSLYRASLNACRFYLVDNQRYVSRVNTAGIYRYGRNAAVAEHFLAFLIANSWSVANGRNQLPTRKNETANWFIRSLSIQ